MAMGYDSVTYTGVIRLLLQNRADVNIQCSQGTALRRVHPLSFRLGPKKDPPGAEFGSQDGLNPKSPGAHAPPKTTNFRPPVQGRPLRG